MLVHRIVGLDCFALRHPLQWLMPAVAMLVSRAFFDLDAIDEELDDPFDTAPNDIPPASRGATFETDQRGRLGETELPPFAQPRGLLL